MTLTLGAGFAAGSFLASFKGPEGPGGKRRVSRSHGHAAFLKERARSTDMRGVM